MAAVWGVGAGREAASATTPAVTPAPTGPATPAVTPAATEPSRATSVPTTAPGTGRSATQKRDFDGDGIPDDRDACPTRPETVNGFQDGDGCPDVVATTGAS